MVEDQAVIIGWDLLKKNCTGFEDFAGMHLISLQLIVNVLFTRLYMSIYMYVYYNFC